MVQNDFFFLELKPNVGLEEMIVLKCDGLRRCRSVLLTFSDFTTAIRSMLSLNSSLYLAAKAILTFQIFILNKFPVLFQAGCWWRS